MLRYPLLLLAVLALLAGIWAGLLRLGWVWPAPQPDLAAAHGPLMVSAFLGAVIGLERAVALNRRAAYLVPVAAMAGGLVLISGVSWRGGLGLLALSSLGLAVVCAVIVRRHRADYTVAMLAGAVAWLVGSAVALLGRPLYLATPWWMAFLVLTIAGERLELSRVLRPTTTTRRLFAAAAGVFGVGVIVTLLNYDAGARLAGLGLILLALWLLRYDLARRNLRQRGLTRFIAACLFGGYVWLAIGGLLWLGYGGVPAGPIYDAALHAVFLGFVFAMIFGHAPLIFPSILRRPMAYLPVFYLPLIALHASLALRVAGDLLGRPVWRQWGGLLNGVTVVLFLVIMAAALVIGRYEMRNTRYEIRVKSDA